MGATLPLDEQLGRLPHARARGARLGRGADAEERVDARRGRAGPPDGPRAIRGASRGTGLVLVLAKKHKVVAAVQPEPVVLREAVEGDPEAASFSERHGPAAGPQLELGIGGMVHGLVVPHEHAPAEVIDRAVCGPEAVQYRGWAIL